MKVIHFMIVFIFQQAFIRPSPSKGSLGGLSTYTNDAISLCEASGYELIIVESVGVGQSEIEISHCVDMFILLISPGAGDSLQGKVHE
jgi:LAO/AO transport system kinase